MIEKTDHIEEWLAKIPSLEVALQQVLAAQLMAEIQAAWSSESPSAAGSPPAIDTGALAASLQQNDDRVGSPLGYAAQLEYGTSRMAARPWLRPAVERVRPRLAELIAQVIQQGGSNGTDQGGVGQSLDRANFNAQL